MTRAELYFTDGSPFARLCRILVHEWNLAVDMVELPHPLPQDYFAKNPLGHVPLLKTVGEQIFPTLPIVEQLWAMSEYATEPFFDPMENRQMLAAILTTFDALISARQQDWAGLEPKGANKLGFNPAERNLKRVENMLAWLNDRLDPEATSINEYAIACLLLWADSRGPVEWRQHDVLVQIVDRLSARDSFQATAPGDWKPAA